MKTIGILGGIGPQATMDLEAKIHRAAQRRLPRHANTGYPPLVTVYVRHPPVLVDEAGRPRRPLTVDPRLLDVARRLGQWADLIVVSSNTPHRFLDALRDAAGREIVDMIALVVDALRSRAVDRVGLVGLGIPDVYVERLASAEVEMITAPDEARAALDRAILRLMEGSESEEDRRAGAAAVDAVRAAGAPVTVLGCTEIPLLLGDGAAAADLIDPATLLADEAVRRAIGEPGD